MLAQEFFDFLVLRYDGAHQRCVLVEISRFYVSFVLYEHLDDFKVTVGCGKMQRRLAVPSLSIDIRPMLNQKLRRDRVAALGRKMQWGLTIFSPGICNGSA